MAVTTPSVDHLWTERCGRAITRGMDEEKVTDLSAERDAYLRQLRNELLRQRDEAIGERNKLLAGC